MGGLKTKGRGKDRQKRKSRKTSQKMAPMTSPEVPKKNILRNIIEAVSKKVEKEKFENWSLDIGPRVTSQMLGRHVFKEEEVEIDLRKL